MVALAPPLILWSLYDHPTDHPQHFVLRRFEVYGARVQPTDDLRLFDSLNAARSHATGMGLVSLARSPEDDPKIVESWL